MAIINNSQGLFVTLPINTKYNPENPIVEDFPTHYDQNGYGGFMAIDSSISEVNSATSLTGKYELIIPEKRRKLGMLIYDVNPSISSFYQCTDVAACSWEEVNFRFRYFYGPTAPAVSNIQVGEKWFDTIVGSEYTYLPIAEGSSEKAWVDIDHIGEGETFSGYMTVDLANTYYVNIGGDEMTGSLTAHKVFRGSKDINFDEDEFVTKSFVFANFPESSGGVFTAHITGTSARFSGGVTAAKFNATQAITEDTQLATKKYVDDNTIRGVDFHIDDQPNPFSTDTDAISISGGSNINILFDQSTNPNRYVISSTLEVADQFVNIDGDTMTGTLTGTDASFDSITASNGFVGTLTADRVFRESEVLFEDNEFITKYYTDNIDENLITNGNFLVWQRGQAFRVLSDTRVKNQSKRQIGLLYYNVEHNTNSASPSQYIGGRYRVSNYNYGSMTIHGADRWNFGWQNYGTADSFSPLTGQGFYVYRGFINSEDGEIVKNSSYFSRITTSPPPSNSPNRPNYIRDLNNSGFEFLRDTVNPTSPNGLTYGAITSYLLGDDRPSDLQGRTADFSRVTDFQYVSNYFDPYNTCVPITGDTDILGQRAALRDNYWASIRHVIPQKHFKKMKFGTPQAEDLTLRFYARSNVVGDYYVTFQSAWPSRVDGETASICRLSYKKYTIDNPNTWKLIEIGLSGDTSNISSTGFGHGPWYNNLKNDANIGLSIWWIMGCGSRYLESQGTPDNYDWKYQLKWGGNTQVNLLGATGNYFDIAEVSLVKSSHQGKIYFPSKDSEILDECKQYYQNVLVSTSESTQANTNESGAGTCPGTDVILQRSTNEYGIELNHPIRRVQDTITTFSPIVYSNVRTDDEVLISLTETAFTRIHTKIHSKWNNGTFPGKGPGPDSQENSDLNRLSDSWDVGDNIGSSLVDIVHGMTAHTNSPFSSTTNLNKYGWDDDNDLTNYFKLAYGERGWCSPACYMWNRYQLEDYSENGAFYIKWTRKSNTQRDSALFGNFSYDAEYLWNEID